MANLRGMIAAGIMAVTCSVAMAMGTGEASAKTKIAVGVAAGPSVTAPCWIGDPAGCDRDWRRTRIDRNWRHDRRWRHHHRHYYNDWPPIGGVYYYYNDGYNYGKLSCASARSIVRGNGYRDVVTRDCRGRTYVFKARKRGHVYLIKVNARNGHIIDRVRL
ncbi:MAG: hypothetical protein KDK89_14730 [Alphaproteobacteria bacterium]|nr:hypothetical protein [Alphaproteobacteria bacterium]